jgi:hypothetical protein
VGAYPSSGSTATAQALHSGIFATGSSVRMSEEIRGRLGEVEGQEHGLWRDAVTTAGSSGA